MRLSVCGLLSLALVAAGCAVRFARPSGATRETEAGGAKPQAAPESVPSDPRQALAAGYRAYRDHRFGFAADCLTFAANHDTGLTDYPLYYLGLTDRELRHEAAAEAAMRRLVDNYPQSVFASRAGLAIADIELKAGHATEAAALASHVLGVAADKSVEQDARLLLARALIASGDPRGAYLQLETLRQKYPRCEDDAAARALQRTVLEAHPDIVDVNTVRYRLEEGELLLREGLASEALLQVDEAMRLSPPHAKLAEILWLEARAARRDPARARRALTEYLVIAPRGPAAPNALDRLGHLYWNLDDSARARKFFMRLARDFPSSRLAPEAMFSTGRTFEDEGELQKARTQYERLSARYPASEVAVEARFRAAFILYMSGEYGTAARRFGALAGRAERGAHRDMFLYWQARALDDGGMTHAAHAIFERLAMSTDSNYYPALASRRLGLWPRDARLAAASHLPAEPLPALDGDGAFHLTRALKLRELGLQELEPGELRALERYAARSPALGRFVLEGFDSSGAWHDAIVAASRMHSRGELDGAVAERFRYPRAFWDLIAPASQRERLDPYLMLALARQESLFDPRARSSADARGLMQLLPITAGRVAGASGDRRADLYNPAVNVELGTAYFRHLLDLFHGDQFKAIAAYNAGERAVRNWTAKFSGDDDQWVENIGYRETRDYVKQVIGGLREYRLLYLPSGAGAPAKSAAYVSRRRLARAR